MDNRQLIQQSLDYIEENLKAEITAQELAEMAGFSIYHYYKVFQTAVGIPVMQYIQRRRLLNAIYDIRQGSQMTATALVYGFDTFAGFYKAFKREFGYTPSQFLEKYEARKPYKINLFREEHIMITHKKIREILKNWNLQNEEIKNAYFESSGIHNENAYYVGDKYMIKFSANLGKIRKHILLSDAIERVGLHAAAAFETVDGQKIVEDGELYYCLIKRLEGNQLKTASFYEDDYAQKARFLGEIIGQLHLALKDLDVEVPEAELYQNVVNQALPDAKKHLELNDEFCDQYVNHFGDIYDNLPRQVIHRNPNPSNIITNGSAWGFTEFELSEKNIRIYDPCYAATAILSESFATATALQLSKWIEIYKNIIYGYDSVVELSEDEKAAIPYVILSNQFICVSWFAKQDKYQDIYQVNVKMSRWIVENLDNLNV